MFTENKRYPAFTDTDIMEFGKFKGESLQDVPPKYLAWLWSDGIKDYSKNFTEHELELTNPVLFTKIKLANYIWNSQDAIAQELGNTFI
jgi:hypothetical protein